MRLHSELANSMKVTEEELTVTIETAKNEQRTSQAEIVKELKAEVARVRT